ncbi:IS701 family transposase, partial [Paludisphaera soli]|uniref:IS701 family transposase n=1 Tax=Paludisphaera soli TaxID=2712865 RepID=UPI0013EC5595
MSSLHPTPAPCQRFVRLAGVLDKRSASRLALLFVGAVLARGRRTVTTWIRAARLSDRFRSCYIAVAAAVRRADRIAVRLLNEDVAPMAAGSGRLTLAIDDTPTRRYGPYVQGAGVHHNPTPGPAGSPHVYGHVFVVLALLVEHGRWGVIALPLLSRLYVRKVDLPAIDPKHRPAFRTKLEMAVELLRWAKPWLGLLRRPIWVVADGAYAKKELPRPAKALGMTVVSRLRKDAALRTVPGPRPYGRRGRPRVYGEGAISLAKRAGQRRGWSRGRFDLYDGAAVKRYKTFLATWRPAGGVIRVVLVDEPHGWRAYFCTDPEATVADVLTTIADRFSLETAFREIKKVVGGGEQQVRFIHAGVGAFHVCLWTYTLTEAWAWSRSALELVDRSESPWDEPTRRPSHADKRRAWRRDILAGEILAILRAGPSDVEIQAAADRLLRLAA